MVLIVIFKFQITKEVNIHNNIQKRNIQINSPKNSNILQQETQNYFMKIHHQLFNNQANKLSSLSEIDNII